MTSAAVSAWTSSIREMQHLVDGGAMLVVGDDGVRTRATAGSAAGSDACETIRCRLIDQPPLTRAVWKKLTLEVKVSCRPGWLPAQQHMAAP